MLKHGFAMGLPTPVTEARSAVGQDGRWSRLLLFCSSSFTPPFPHKAAFVIQQMHTFTEYIPDVK